MAKSADPDVVAEIRRLASDSQRVMITRTAQFDLVARHLTKDEICQVIIDWIDSGERIKPTSDMPIVFLVLHLKIPFRLF